MIGRKPTRRPRINNRRRHHHQGSSHFRLSDVDALASVTRARRRNGRGREQWERSLWLDYADSTPLVYEDSE